MDLQAFEDKVKPDGFILGHDFSYYRSPRTFGVIAAVREFTAATGFQLVIVTNETNPSCLLVRGGNDSTLPALRERLLGFEGGRPIEVDDALLDRLEQVGVNDGDGQKGRIMRFGRDGVRRPGAGAAGQPRSHSRSRPIRR